MVTRDTPWPEGTPCWVDLSTDDLDKACAFYGALFGWQLQRGGPETGGYTMATRNGRPVAGIGPKMGEAAMPTVWTTYLATDDADAAATKINSAGGKIMMGPMDVMDVGRMIVAADPGGAVFGVWQARAHSGFQVANEPGCVVWNENMSRDYRENREFYSAVFGYEYGDIDDPNMKYATLNLPHGMVGGIGELPAGVPAEVPAYWMTYFSVTDADAAAAQVTELGGTVQQSPFDTPYGRMAMVTDDQGAPFSLMSEAKQS